MQASRGLVLACTLLLVAVGGCVASSDVSAPGTSDDGAGDDGKSYDASNTMNEPGSFHYSGGVGHKTETESYAWTNVAPTAQVMWAGAAYGGSFTLTISDTAGLVVYEQTISGNEGRASQEATSLGVPGQWTIQFTFEDFSGSMDLQISSG